MNWSFNTLILSLPSCHLGNHFLMVFSHNQYSNYCSRIKCTIASFKSRNSSGYDGLSNKILKIYGNYIAYKILSNIILEKIKPYIEEITGDYQNGFRVGRSIIDNIFALKILNEKIWEFKQSVQYLFIDFQKAYDSIHRDTLWKCMEEFKIPTKLINMCKTCVQKTRSAVRIDGT